MTMPPAASAKALVLGGDQALGAAPQLRHQHAPRRGALRPLLGIRRAGGQQVAQALDAADRLVLDHDRAVVLDPRELGAALQALEQHLRAAVDEALGQPVVQRIAQRVLDRARALLPVRRIAQPVGVVGDVGPGADVREPRDQRVDVAGRALEPRDLVGDPVGRQPPVVGEMAEHPVEQMRGEPRSASCGSPGSGRPPRAGARRQASRRAPAPRRAAPAP